MESFLMKNSTKMKQILFILISSLYFFSGCSKEKDIPTRAGAVLWTVPFQRRKKKELGKNSEIYNKAQVTDLRQPHQPRGKLIATL